MTIDEIGNLIPPANPYPPPVPWLSPRQGDGEWPPANRETADVGPPEPASTPIRWPRVFPGL